MAVRGCVRLVGTRGAVSNLDELDEQGHDCPQSTPRAWRGQVLFSPLTGGTCWVWDKRNY